MLKNRNLQAEWMPRLEVKAERSGTKVEGEIAVMNGAVPHNFPDGDPVLKQFYLTVTVKDKNGRLLGTQTAFPVGAPGMRHSAAGRRRRRG